MEAHDQLNLFDGATVVMIAVGLVISSILVYFSLPETGQGIILSSSVLLDLHEQWQRQAEIFAFMTRTVDGFYDQFYVAFVEIASADYELLPGLAWHQTYDTFVALGDTVAENYRKPQPVYSLKVVPGAILGIFTEF